MKFRAPVVLSIGLFPLVAWASFQVGGLTISTSANSGLQDGKPAVWFKVNYECNGGRTGEDRRCSADLRTRLECNGDVLATKKVTVSGDYRGRAMVQSNCFLDDAIATCGDLHIYYTVYQDGEKHSEGGTPVTPR